MEKVAFIFPPAYYRNFDWGREGQNGKKIVTLHLVTFFCDAVVITSLK